MSVTEFDVEFARAQFPQYRDPTDRQVAMFENAGGAYAPDQVVDKLSHFFNHTKVQPYYLYRPSLDAGAAMDRSRQLLAASMNAEVDEIHLGPSTTLNLYVLAHALRTQMTEGDEIVVSHQDHEANIGAWVRLGNTGINIKVWQPDPDSGLLDTDDLAHLLTDRTQLVCVTHCSNVVAVVNPIAEITALCHAAGARVVVDGVSFTPHDVVDVRVLNVDFYVYSLYKTFGPHLGLLYVRRDHIDELPNQGHFFHDGEPTKRLTPAGPDHGEIACAGGIVDYYQTLYEHHWPQDNFADATLIRRLQRLFGAIQAYEHTLVAPLLAYLAGKPRVRVIGYSAASTLQRAPTVAFNVLGLDNSTIAAAMAAENIGCGYGHFYSYRLMERLNIDPAEGVMRLSTAHYNTAAEISRAIEVLDRLL
jgi:cysteine desulfurase family protein (TIGR01976 family)